MSETPLAPTTLINQSAVLIRSLDPDGRCDYVNAAWSGFTGRDALFELGDGWTAGIHPDDRPAAITAIMRGFKLRTPYEVEYRLLRHDRVYRWVVDRGVPLLVDGVFRGILSASLDVQDRREALHAREATLRVVAAELRTPLQAARVLTELARRQCEAGQTPDESIFETLEEQFERFHELLSRLSFRERERSELRGPLRHTACSHHASPREGSGARGRRAG